MEDINNTQQPPSTPASLASRLLSLQPGIRPDRVAQHYHAAGVDLRIRVLPPEGEYSKPMIVIEGHAEALLFLADLLLAQATDELDCGFQVDLPAPGLLSDQSQYGIYIHALPCGCEGETG